jgi:hypothetical protein
MLRKVQWCFMLIDQWILHQGPVSRWEEDLQNQIYRKWYTINQWAKVAWNFMTTHNHLGSWISSEKDKHVKELLFEMYYQEAKCVQRIKLWQQRFLALLQHSNLLNRPKLIAILMLIYLKATWLSIYPINKNRQIKQLQSQQILIRNLKL